MQVNKTMGKLKSIGYELRDVAVVQAPVSFVNHRGEVDPFVEICNRRVYPIFVAPMASVTDENNYKVWIENGVTPVVPRSVQLRLSFEDRMVIARETFVSISLNEAKENLFGYLEHYEDQVADPKFNPLFICIDIAHGTLSDLYNICKEIKRRFPYVIIMAGNVANPSAYSFYADAGIDYMRASVGSGSRCTSSANVSVHYPLASLLDALNEERKAYAHSHNGYAPTKIIADGGIGWFDDIQKSLALGADAVMCGKIFAECEEACEPIYYAKSIEKALSGVRYTEKMLDQLEEGDEGEILELEGHHNCHTLNLSRFRDYYGMSTKRAQKETGGTGNRTSEGLDRPVEVKYPVAKWIDNMQSYLRSCMTYTNSRTIQELRENAQVIILGGSGDVAYRK